MTRGDLLVSLSIVSIGGGLLLKLHQLVRFIETRMAWVDELYRVYCEDRGLRLPPDLERKQGD